MRSDLCGLKFHMHSNFLSGYENENIITRWDSDRYLRSTFQVASNFFKPDIVVFLGDLTDEGSLSNDQLFSEYASRFMTLFHVDSSVKTIYLPGKLVNMENDSYQCISVPGTSKSERQKLLI